MPRREPPDETSPFFGGVHLARGLQHRPGRRPWGTFAVVWLLATALFGLLLWVVSLFR